MSRVLCTGAGGMIGGYLVRCLLLEGHEVVAADVKPVEQWWQVHVGASNLGGPEGDMSDAAVATRAMRGATEVYALAARMGGIGFIEQHAAECILQSSLISAQTLQAALAAGVERVFYSSSACVYAAGKQRHAKVTALREEDAWPAEPERGYGTEKLATEEMHLLASRDFGIQARIARYHNVYSGSHLTWEGGAEKSPAALCRKVAEAVVSGDRRIEIWGDGEQTRSFMHIDDCVEGTLRIMRSDYAEPLNLGSDRLVTVNELVSIIEEIAGVRLERTYDLSAPQGVMGRNSDNTRIRSVLGWAPSIDLEQGLVETYHWILEQVRSRHAMTA